MAAEATPWAAFMRSLTSRPRAPKSLAISLLPAWNALVAWKQTPSELALITAEVLSMLLWVPVGAQDRCGSKVKVVLVGTGI